MITLGRVELNITFRCNIKCQNCNRLCNILTLDKDMTLGQIQLFLNKLQEENKHIRRVKVVGGEPTMHPEFLSICLMLSLAVANGLIDKVVVNTNGVDPKYNLSKEIFPGVTWKVSKPSKKTHRPFLWSPRDLGLETKGPCSMPKVCGFSLDARGWLPCSAAPALVRVFGLEHLYRPLNGPLPPALWGLDDLCPICIHSVNDEAMRGKRFVDAPLSWTLPTATWQEKLKEYIKSHPEQVVKYE